MGDFYRYLGVAIAHTQSRIMSFPKYDRYKNSGVEWLGEVPEHWNIDRLKRNLHLLTEKTTRRENPVALENIQSWTGCFVPTETEFEGEGIAFECGDILFGKLRPYLAKAYLAKVSGEAVGDFHVMRPGDILLGQYSIYQILNREFIAIVDGSTFGAKMPRVSWEFMANIAMGIPPLPEQRSIATFLDRETTKIDELIAEQRQLIDLLKEKRQAVISHAVTKGLNPDAPMKDSAIEWLGEVPEHWEIFKVRRFLTEHKQGYYSSDPYVNDGVKLLRITDLLDFGNVNFDNCPSVVKKEDTALFLLQDGDFVFARTGGAGTFGVIHNIQEPVIFASYLIRFRFNDKFDKSFLRYSFLAENFQGSLKQNIHGGVNQNVHAEDIKEQYIAFPLLPEQRSIAAFLDREIAKLDELIAEAQHAIALLQERRTALISAAVTGKIDVRSLV